MTVTEVADDSDGVLAALDGLTAAVEENIKDERILVRRLGRLRAGRAKGAPLQDLLAGEKAPGALGLTAQLLRRLTDAAGRLRRALARGLRAEGVTIPAIAALFGVSHQRVSALLRRGDPRPPL